MVETIEQLEREAEGNPELDFYFSNGHLCVQKAEIEPFAAEQGRYPHSAEGSIRQEKRIRGTTPLGAAMAKIPASETFCELCFLPSDDCVCDEMPEYSDEEISGKTYEQVMAELEAI